MHTSKDWKCCEQYDGSTKIIETPTLKQWGRSVCAYCNHFIKYVENPMLKQNHDILVQLNQLMNQNIIIDEIEKKFINRCINHKVLTKNQINYLHLLQKIYILS